MNSSLPPDDSLNSSASQDGVPDAAAADSASLGRPTDERISEPFLATAADKSIELPRLSKKHRGPQVNWWIPVSLLAATCLSTFFAGSMSWQPHETLGAAVAVAGKQLGMIDSSTVVVLHGKIVSSGADVVMDIRQTILRHAGQGCVYMVCVIAILFAHEMGHYVATRIYKIPSTPPFFIPFPIAPIGTMGAVIAMKGQEANRREIFDIGIAGPLAGLVFAIPILWFGVGQMEPVAPNFGTYKYDLPLLVRWMYSVRHPAAPMLTEVTANQVNAMFMAGWVGLLITGLNMMPVSQLDGGHVTYTLFGSYSRWIARVFVGVALTYMILNRVYIWMLMLALVFLIGLYHPPTSDDSVPLGKWRIGLGCLSLLIPILCFPPRGLMP